MGALNIGMVAPIIGGGIRTQLNNVIPLLQAKGHVITVLTSDVYKLGNFDVIRVKSLRFPSRSYGFMPALIWVMGDIVEKWDIIHVHGYPCYPADLLTVFRLLHKKPIVITLHGSFHQYTSHMNLFAKRLHNSIMLKFVNNIDRFIAVSCAEKWAVAKGGLPADKVEVVYNGVDPMYSKFEPARREQLSEKRILYLGRLTNSKNVGLLVEAMKHVVNMNNNVKLILAGPDFGERKRLEALVSKLNIKKYVDFTGEVTEEQKIQLLASCDIFVQPSLQDIFSISILEASAASLPVIAFNVGGNSEMIVDGKTGILVDDLTPWALANAILSTLNDKDALRTMGAKGQEYVLNKFSWETTADLLQTVYQEVLQ